MYTCHHCRSLALSYFVHRNNEPAGTEKNNQPLINMACALPRARSRDYRSVRCRVLYVCVCICVVDETQRRSLFNTRTLCSGRRSTRCYHMSSPSRLRTALRMLAIARPTDRRTTQRRWRWRCSQTNTLLHTSSGAKRHISLGALWC